MKKFSLTQLLIFFKRQQCVGFQGINFCIAIIESTELSDVEKFDEIIDLLQRLEFYDDEYTEKRINRLKDEIQMEKEDDIAWDIPEMGPVNPTQVFDCVFLNGKVQFEWNLN